MTVMEGDTEVHYVGTTSEDEGKAATGVTKVLLRHKFSDGWYYYRVISIDGSSSSAASAPADHAEQLQVQVSKSVEQKQCQAPLDDEAQIKIKETMKRRLPEILDVIVQAQQLTVGIVPRNTTISWSSQLVSYYESSKNGYYRYDHGQDDTLFPDGQPRWKGELAAYERAQEQKKKMAAMDRRRVADAKMTPVDSRACDAPWTANFTKKVYSI
jgi:hypothetical protein